MTDYSDDMGHDPRDEDLHPDGDDGRGEDKTGLSKLHLAVIANDCSELLALIVLDKNQIDIPSENTWRTTNMIFPGECSPLHFAVRLHHAECVEILLRNGANPNSRNCLGSTPLFYAEGIAMARLLTQYGADISHTNFNGDTPLHVIRNRQSRKYLLNLGADPHARNDDARVADDGSVTYDDVDEDAVDNTNTPSQAHTSDGSNGHSHVDHNTTGTDEDLLFAEQSELFRDVSQYVFVNSSSNTNDDCTKEELQEKIEQLVVRIKQTEKKNLALEEENEELRRINQQLLLAP